MRNKLGAGYKTILSWRDQDAFLLVGEMWDGAFSIHEKHHRCDLCYISTSITTVSRCLQVLDEEVDPVKLLKWGLKRMNQNLDLLGYGH